MASMPNPTSQVNPTSMRSRVVVGGIDTHKDLHVVAVIDTAETVLATHSFSTTRAGYRALVKWLRTFGEVARIGVEGTGSYGAGICRHLTEVGIEVWEVDRPDRSDRRRTGKDDDLDAISAARAALHGRRGQHPQIQGWGGGVAAGASGDPADRDPGPPQRLAAAADDHRRCPRRAA